MSQQQPYLGITKPLSLSVPTIQELELTKDLQKTLEKFGMYDSKEKTAQREAALKHLGELTRELVQSICKKRNIPKEIADAAGGAIFTFGSYRLGVNSAEQIFSKYGSNTKKVPCISEITSVPDSFVPVIKFKYNDIPIDFVCARVSLPQVTESTNLKDASILRGLDDRCIRSINGTRVADEIIRLVPDIETFRIALRCIKLWAMRKAVYSNVLGFFGGVAWAILVARVCQLYPNACASVIVSKFFSLWKSWKWPLPVTLKPIEDGPPLNPSLRPWSPSLNINRTHRMPIITPCYPSMCTTHNVTASTQRIILGEFNIASQITEKIMQGTLPWASLFQSHDFFRNYKYYLQVIVSSDHPERQLKWSGLVEAKLRHLVTKLELVPALALVHPYVEGFKYEFTCENSEDVYAATHGQIIPSRRNSSRKTMKIYTKVFYLGLYIRIKSGESRTLDLTAPIYEFMNMVKSWSEFNSKHMGIAVENVRHTNLPEEVLPKREIKMSKRALSKSPSPTLQPTMVNSSVIVNKKVKTNTDNTIPPPTDTDVKTASVAV
ncbi:Poly(A) polymerase central domain-containing protein [Cokeromyces recurvatus]|uniref:Poly(A) polymerase central domain-containing protein n=1 Tax=Cokeromyces recurvatus TaxID=90255 RepID=UPI002220F33F|nr:Poly(A) polymerase central domain-containing protein [Cokeromyces recurvatus]KAI7901483.1 Poly(A) polymerase central domain-containing protein [Cokeromyces recurvatus]